MNSRWLRLVCVGLVLSGTAYASVTRAQENGVSVRVQPVEYRKIVQTVQGRGEMAARASVELSVPYAGRLSRLEVAEAQSVEAGQVVAVLDHTGLRAEHEARSAQLQMQKTKLAQCELRFEDARLKQRRIKALRDRGVTTLEAWESAIRETKSSKLEREHARLRLRQLRAQLDQVQAKIGDATLRSPIAGQVLRTHASVGEQLPVAGAHARVATIADLSDLRAELEVDETEVVDLRVGQRVWLRFDAIPEQRFAAELSEIAPAAHQDRVDDQVSLFRVRAQLERRDPRVRPGMSVHASIEVARRDKILAVPIQSVQKRKHDHSETLEDDSQEPAQKVWVVEEGRVRQQTVELGISDDTHVEVVSGLDNNQVVVVGPYRTLRELKSDLRVTPQPSKMNFSRVEGTR